MSSLVTAQSLLFISQEFTIYASFFILFIGVFGHLANIFVLVRLTIFRGNPSSFYLIAESIVDLLELTILLTSRIAMNGFLIDLTQTSLIWCKLRPLLVQSSTLMSMNIVCFATFDQCLSTSYIPYIRQMSKIKLAKILTIIATIIWTLHGILAIIFFEIRPKAGCNMYNQIFLNYVSYFYYPVLTGILPIIVSSFFSILAYRNVRRIVRLNIPMRRRKLDQQLTAMILIRVAFLVVITLPYVVHRIYMIIVVTNGSDIVWQAIVQLISAILTAMFHLNFAGSFYLFLISSKRFRRQVKFAFLNRCVAIRRNQVNASGEHFDNEIELESTS